MTVPVWQRVLGWLVSLLVPVALALLVVRLLLNPWFLTFEYNTPAFPADPYGFTKEERLYWSGIALDYLVNSEGIDFLGDLRFDNGEAVYNERELKHMVDVKVVLGGALRVGYASLAGLALLGIWARLGGWWVVYRHAMSRGGWLTVALVGTILLLVLLSFGVFFVAFHRVFFEGDSWLFLWSDTLIRLFPERFWRDIFLLVGGLSTLFGLGVGYIFKKKELVNGSPAGFVMNFIILKKRPTGSTGRAFVTGRRFYGFAWPCLATASAALRTVSSSAR